MEAAFRLDPLFNYNRAVALRLTPFLARTPLTPNQITTISLLMGFVSAFCMAQGTRVGMLAGAFFLQIHFILDNCDGEIARLKSMQSRFGMWYDYIADLAADTALFTGLGIGAGSAALFGWHPLAWVSLAVAGSFINFFRVIAARNRKKDIPSPPKRGFISSLMNTLGDDGDPSLLVWGFALYGHPIALLVCGAAYIHILWIYCLLLELA